MNEVLLTGLARRERQVMDVLFREKSATAKTIHAAIPEPPSYSAVRALLSTLEGKGLVSHVVDKRQYVYSPVVAKAQAKKSALKGLLSTFFDNRPENLVASLLEMEDQDLSAEDLDRIKALLGKA